MVKLHIKLINLYLVILFDLNYVQSTNDEHEPFSYPFCAEGEHGMALVDETIGREAHHRFYKNNTSSSCVYECLTLQYNFAGTKNKFCFCADSIKNDIESATCDKKCPGDENEICGGEQGISLYKTEFQSTETKIKEVTTAAINTTVIVTQTQLTTELQSTKNQIKTESHILVTTAAAQESSSERASSEREKGEGISTATVLYIVTPIVIVMSGVVALLICLIVRRRRVKRECNVSYQRNGSEHSCHTSDAGKNLENENLLDKNADDNLSTRQHVENTTKYEKTEAYSGTEYSTIYSADSPQAVHTYGCLKAQPGMTLTLPSNYSHKTVSKTSTNPKFTDNTYSHIGNDKSTEISIENGSERDSTYNILQASPQKHAVVTSHKLECDQDSVYDHTTAGAGPQNELGNTADEYEHLNSISKEKVITDHCRLKEQEGKHTCDSMTTRDNGMYEEADHHYFILEPKK